MLNEYVILLPLALLSEVRMKAGDAFPLSFEHQTLPLVTPAGKQKPEPSFPNATSMVMMDGIRLLLLRSM